jgi:hypothetical protein
MRPHESTFRRDVLISGMVAASAIFNLPTISIAPEAKDESGLAAGTSRSSHLK